MTTPESPSKAAPPEHHEELEQLKGLFRSYGQPVLIGLAAVAILILGWNAYNNFRASKRAELAEQLFTATSPEQLQQLATGNADAPVAPMALLLAASRWYDGGQFETAETIFGQFSERYPTHSLRPYAAFGRAQSLEAARRYDQANEAYAELIQAHPDHLLAGQATLGRARCLEAMGNTDGAREVYTAFLATQPNSPWAANAEAGLDYLEMNVRAAARPASKTQQTGAEPVSFQPTPPAEQTAPTVAAPAPVETIEVEEAQATPAP